MFPSPRPAAFLLAAMVSASPALAQNPPTTGEPTNPAPEWLGVVYSGQLFRDAADRFTQAKDRCDVAGMNAARGEMDAIQARLRAQLEASRQAGPMAEGMLAHPDDIEEGIRGNDDIRQRLEGGLMNCRDPDEDQPTTVPQPEIRPDRPPPGPVLEHVGIPQDTGLYAGLGATYFKEEDIDIALVTGTVGYAFHRNFAVEAEVSIGVLDESASSGSTEVSIGIPWSVVPYAVARLPLSDDARLFARAGYGLTRFEVNIDTGTVNTSDASTEGHLSFGGGIDFDVSERGQVRAVYTHQEYDNGSSSDTVGLSFILRFGGPEAI